METDNLKSEDILELIFSIEAKESEDDVIKALLPASLRKLNCFMAGVLKEDNSQLIEKLLLPFVFNKEENERNTLSSSPVQFKPAKFEKIRSYSLCSFKFSRSVNDMISVLIFSCRFSAFTFNFNLSCMPMEMSVACTV